MKSLDRKVTYCTVEHHKVNTPVRNEHRLAKIPWDEEFAKEWAGLSENERAKI
jgi:acyl-coenzyme A thioesterase 13